MEHVIPGPFITALQASAVLIPTTPTMPQTTTDFLEKFTEESNNESGLKVGMTEEEEIVPGSGFDDYFNITSSIFDEF